MRGTASSTGSQTGASSIIVSFDNVLDRILASIEAGGTAFNEIQRGFCGISTYMLLPGFLSLKCEIDELKVL